MKNINKTFKYMAVAAAALPMSLAMLTSCSNEENAELLAQNEVKFTTAISGVIESRADVDYEPTHGYLTVYNNALGSTLNATYGYDTKTDSWKCTSYKPMYWEDLGKHDSYTFYAVAPVANYAKVMEDQRQTDDFVASDLLMARTTVDKVNTPVNLVLKHLMGKLVVNVQTTEDANALTAAELASTTVSIAGLKTAYAVTSGTNADVPAVATADGNAHAALLPYQEGSAYSFIAPAQSTAGMELSFNVTFGTEKRTYIYKVSETNAPALTAGTITAFNITISKSEVALGDVTVTNWATGTTTSATVGLNVNTEQGNTANITSLELWREGENTKTVYNWANNKWTSDAPFYVDNLAADAKFFARHTPATIGSTGIKDILGNTEAVALNNGNIALTLEHLMAQLNITLAVAANYTKSLPLADAKITIPGILPDYTVSDANVVTAAGTATEFVLTRDSYIFAPQKLAAGTEITVALTNGNTYKATLADDLVLSQGETSTLALTIGLTETSVAVSVKPWETGAEEAATLTIVTTGTADDMTDNSEFTSMNLYVDALTATPYTYTKENGAWTSTSPLYLDELVATSKLYAQAVNGSTADALTRFTDVLGTDATTVKGGTVAFTFRHLMAQMNVVLKADQNFTPSLDGAEIVTPQMFKNYTVAIDGNGKMIAQGNEKQAYTFTDTDAHLYVPQTLAKGSTFTVTLQNGNTYEAKLATDVILEAGKNTTITLTLMPTQVGVSATVADWGTASASATVQLAGTNSEIGISGITEAGVLDLIYVQNGELTNTVAGFSYANSKWSSSAPLYWDDITPAAPYTFAAIFRPTTEKPVLELDYLVGVGTAATHGAQVALVEMKHAMAKMNIAVKLGTGITGEELNSLTAEVLLTKSKDLSVNADGTANITLNTSASNIPFTRAKDFFVAPQALGDANIITLTRPNGNKYTVKLIDLKDSSDTPIFTNNKVEAGKHYSIILTVNETGVGITASIAAWTEVSGSGTMTPDFN